MARARRRTSLRSIALVVLATVIVAIVHLLLKLALRRADGYVALLFDPLLIAGVLLTGVGGVVMTTALKHGDLSALYPFISLGFIWVVLEGVLFFGETLSAMSAAGIGVIIVGVSLIGHHSMRRGARRRPARAGRRGSR